ncbi:NAD(P)H-quinone dehydrogenase [Corynebacterium yudongzhengii]|uniref:NAD(P)H-quinone dehydrogenase n=1 Tax=Corynebacterium yudongzhengii TaxID=2080740 RepID=A0A2U1T731_9CORY|nr:NAD(P)H-quinone dehydrogenase [Corynebacterium yudongzhengii]AWB81356.1 NAD(P)H-quinone dehydrogenase [Corynebacterium yudongzhengii]PWC01799.1 NAD(P)H-quinone dehydrogenase [Corynebacterium yudongzhengii]
MKKRIVIIGGGPGGYEAALVGAANGAEITVVEDSGMGGASVRLDCVPSKSFIAAANIKTDLRRADDMGLNEGIGATHLSLTALNKRVAELASRQSEDISKQMKDSGVTVIKGRGSFTKEQKNSLIHTVTVEEPDGTTRDLDADIVLLASGAHPRVLPGARPDGERILDWQQIYDLTELPEHLVVVGSGVTGAEFVSAFAELGVKVTMVASRDRILPHDDADAADVLEEVLAERGVNLEKDARVESVENTGDGVIVKTQDGREIRGSHCLMSIGSIPNTEALGLDKPGVETTASGHIEVDRVSRTNVPGIYAAGDCTNSMPLAAVAAMQGRIAMNHALGDSVQPLRMKTVAQAVFTRPEIAAIGVTEKQIADGDVQARAITLPLASNPRAKMRSLSRGFVKLFCSSRSGTIIGGVIVAPIASELITTLALAVSRSVTVNELADTFSVYPSLSGSITEAARRLIQHDVLD